jgi:shikimate kinase
MQKEQGLREMFWALDDAMKVMTVGGITLTDNKHG